MSEDAKKTDEPTEKKAAKTAPKTVRVVIMTDGVFSSLGVHNKGDKVELPEEDVAILEDRGFATRLGE